MTELRRSTCSDECLFWGSQTLEFDLSAASFDPTRTLAQLLLTAWRLILFAEELFAVLFTDIVITPNHDLPRTARVGKAEVLTNQSTTVPDFDIDHIDRARLYSTSIHGWFARFS